MMLKVLHTGDLHLGMTHKSRNYPEALRQELVEARLETLQRLVNIANEEGCHLFIVAGDLFHSTNVPKETILKAAQVLGHFEGSCVAVLPGNHDYYSEMSPLWQVFTEHMADHVFVLAKNEPYSLLPFGLDAVLYPAACDKKHSSENRLGWIAKLLDKPEGRWHLGVAHGTVKGVSPDFDGRYFPMERDELERLGMDHWFLGHSHVRVPDQDEAENCGLTFCGTPEPDGFDCRHTGFAWVTEFFENRVLNRSLRPGGFRFYDMEREIRQLDELQSLLADVLASGDKTLVKLSLTGMLPQEEYRQRFAAINELAAGLAYLECEDGALDMEVTEETIDEEFSQGSFPHLLLSGLVREGDHDALQLAYQLIKKVKK